MIKAGLVSITFRDLSPGEIIKLVSLTRLAGIEWGGDVHVPHGDIERAKAVKKMTGDAGLSVAGYGSYYRVGDNSAFPFSAVLDTAGELGAPVIRVWAGRKSSCETDPAYREMVVDEARRIAEAAAARGIKIAFEFHGQTLTDTTESTIGLLTQANHPNLRSYWQPPVGWDETILRGSLEQILPYLENLHVFNWNEKGERFPLDESTKLWRPLLSLVKKKLPDAINWAMIEFVPEDRPDALRSEAKTLTGWIA